MPSDRINYLPYVLEFDGQDDHVILPEMEVDYSQGFAIEAWVYYNSFKSWSCIINFGNGANQDNILFANIAKSNTLALNIYKKGAETQQIKVENVLSIGQWMHLAVTIDAEGNAKLYKNAQEIQSGKLQPPPNVNRTVNYIGKSHWASDEYFDGRISEVRLWNRARSLEEIQRDLHCRLLGNEAGLVGYWPLNDGTGDTASKGGKINGASWHQEIFFPGGDRLSYPQPVLSFYGFSDSIEIKDPFENDKEFTLCLWVKPSVINNGYQGGFMGKNVDRYRKPSLFISPDQSGLQYDSYDGNGKQYNDILNNFFIAADQWIHIAWTKQGTEYKFYRNGELFATKPAPESFYCHKDSTYYIGQFYDYWSGEIAEIAIWNRSRTGDEIKADLYRHLTGNETGLVTYWPLNEGAGDLVMDKTIQGNFATLKQWIWGAPSTLKSSSAIGKSASEQILYLPSSLRFRADYIEIQDPFENEREFTICLWVKPSVINDGSYHGFLGKQGDRYRKPGLWLNTNKGGLHYDSYDIAGKRYSDVLENFFLAANQWVYIVWTKRGTEYKFYRNGELFSTKPAPETFYHNKETSYWFGRVSSFWPGEMAEISIWNYARCEAEIKGDLSDRLAGNELGLVGYWPLNEGTGDRAIDKTKRGNFGKIYGTTWKQQNFLKPAGETKEQNFIKSALKFDGQNDYIVLPAMNVDYSKGFAVEAWVYYNSFKHWSRIIDFTLGESNKSKIVFANQETTDKLALDIKCGDYTQRIIAEKALETGKWMHLSATIDADGNGKFYKNGQEILSAKIQLPEKIDRLQNYIGRSHYSGDGYFHGQMAEVRLWNRTRSPEELQKDMNRRLVGNETGLVGYWPLNEGRGDRVFDRTTSDKFGAIHGAIWPQNYRSDYLQSILKFDGKDDYVAVKKPFTNDKEFTISLWVKPSALNDGSWHGFIGSLFDKHGLWLAPNQGGLYYDSYDWPCQRYRGVLDNFFTSKDQWIHIAWVKQGPEYKFYQNGELFATKPAPETFYYTKNNSYRIGGIDSFWSGEIADVRVWNYPRSLNQIQGDMHSHLVGNEAGLISYWPLDEGIGDTVADRSDRGDRGKIFGATWERQIFFVNEAPIEPPKKEIETKIVTSNDESQPPPKPPSPTTSKSDSLSGKESEQLPKPQTTDSNSSAFSGKEWQQVQKLQPADLTSESFFGQEIAISGEWAIIGASKTDLSEEDAGSAYIFQLQNGVWQQKQTIQSTDSRTDDRFGGAVAINGEWAIVGARKNDASNIPDAGSAYIFRLENGVWQQKQKLQPSDLEANSFFGKTIAISPSGMASLTGGDWAIIGAPHAKAKGNPKAGSAYVFRLENGVWQQKQKLQPSDLEANQCFGHAIAISGEYAFFGGGDRSVSANVKRPGGAYIYHLENSVWQQKQKLPAPQPDTNDLFGCCVAICGEYAFVGAVNTTVSNILGVGTVYTYQLEQGVWQQKQTLQPENPKYCGFFGATVAIIGKVAIVGSTRADSSNIKDTGEAYIFLLENGVWQQKQKLQPDDLHYESYFGFCTRINGEWIFVTAAWANTLTLKRVGAVYIFAARSN